ncbi:TPA: hypothetical protein OTZ30_002226 [Vibrio cholerae]|nr:hypothetical protein [Vibrio cholerae]
MKYQDDLDLFLDKWTVVKGDFSGWQGVVYHNHDPAAVFVWGFISAVSATMFEAHITVGEKALVVKHLRYFGTNRYPSNHSDLLAEAMTEVIGTFGDAVE